MVPWRRSTSASGGYAAANKTGQAKKSSSPSARNIAAQHSDGGVLAVGERVIISGLNGAIELNGKVAVVFGIDSAAGRYIVELEDGGAQKRVRRDNLTPKGTATGVVAARARAAAAASSFASSTHGAAANVAAAGYASASQKFQSAGAAARVAAEKRSLTPVRTRPASTSGGNTGTPPRQSERNSGQIPCGSKVSIGGLTGAAELNGKSGIIRGFDDSSGRYVVELQGSGDRKSLKPNNVSKLSEASMTARDRKFSDLDADLQCQMEDDSGEAPMARLSSMASAKGRAAGG